MPSNREWLNGLAANDPQKLNTWFEAEHVDDSDEISKLIAERDELKAKVDDIMDEPDYREAWERMRKERDEWKAKVDGFTEALEKLGCSVLANGTVFEGSSKVRASSSNLEWLYWHDESFAYGAKRFVVDDGYSCCETLDQAHEWLMAPHANDDSTPESVVMSEAVDANDGNATCNNSGENVTHDSREELRKDIINYTMDAYNGCWLIDVDTIDEWLDRQAEITAKRLCADCTPNVAEERDYLRTRVDELNTQVQELQIEREKLRDRIRNQSHQLSDVQDALERRNKGEFKKRWYKQIDELKSQNVNLAHDLGECMADRDKFRSEIGEMLDAAQQIERIRAKHETQLN